jgi:hypothetical protein
MDFFFPGELTVLILILPTIQRWVQMGIKSLVDFVWRTNELARVLIS